MALAKQQFDFYSTELVNENPYSSDNDKAAIARARLYLAKFAGIDRYYLQMINDADRSQSGGRASAGNSRIPAT